MFGMGLQKATTALLGVKMTEFEGTIYCKAYLPTVDQSVPNIFGCLPKKVECEPAVVDRLNRLKLPVSPFGFLAEIFYSFKSASKDSMAIQIHDISILGYYELGEDFQPVLRRLQPAVAPVSSVVASPLSTSQVVVEPSKDEKDSTIPPSSPGGRKFA